MKYYINNIIVVEGRNDESYLSSFIDAIFVVTNGYEIPKEEVEFLNNRRNTKPVIVLTDSDKAGKNIRDRLALLISNRIDIEVDIVKCNKNNKHGVAECEKDELINVLERHFTNKETTNRLQLNDINDLGINKEKRAMICRESGLGICNSKTFIKRLNYLKISKEELKDYGNK